jgi:DNA processing protein
VSTRILEGEHLPTRLRELARPPERVYLRGTLPVGPAVAVVGTRHPTEAGTEFAATLARELVEHGVVVASGGASGIDRAAHEAALEGRGVTLVVAPGGLERPFPGEHRELFHRIVASGGAYLSLVPDHVRARRGSFFSRNGCLAALCDALIVVEAPVRSGARNAVKQARRLGRPVYAVPHSPWNPAGRGCNAELRNGARLLESARDVLQHLPLGVQPSSERTEYRQGGFGELASGDDVGKVRRALGAGALSADDVCARTGVPAPRVQAALLSLCLAGEVVIDGAGVIRAGRSS